MGATKVVGLSAVLKLVFGGGWIHSHSAYRILFRSCRLGRIIHHDGSRPVGAWVGFILDTFAYSVDCCIFKGQLQGRRKKSSMTQLEVAYRYRTPPNEATMRALDNVREVYGIRRIIFSESERIIRVEFDASR